MCLARSEIENVGIKVFTARNFYKDEIVTAFVGIKTKEDDWHTLEISTEDGSECFLSIPIKGNKKINRVSCVLFLGEHMFNNKRFTGSKKTCNENNYYFGKEEDRQNCLLIY